MNIKKIIRFLINLLPIRFLINLLPLEKRLKIQQKKIDQSVRLWAEQARTKYEGVMWKEQKEQNERNDRKRKVWAEQARTKYN